MNYINSAFFLLSFTVMITNSLGANYSQYQSYLNNQQKIHDASEISDTEYLFQYLSHGIIELFRQNFNLKVNIQFTNQSLNKIHLLEEDIAEITISSLNIHKNFFKVNVKLSAESIVLYGTFKQNMSMPVINKITDNPITMSDISFISVANVPTDAITEVSLILGKHIKDYIPMSPVRKKNLYFPDILKKKSAVVISAVTKNLIVETLGQTLEDVQLNQIVPVINLKSKRVIECIFKGKNIVVPIGFN